MPKCTAAACDYSAEAALSRPRRAWTSGQLSSLFGHLALSSSLSVPSIHPITCLSSGGGDRVHEQASSARSCLAKTRQARQVNTARGSRFHEPAHQRFHAVYVCVCACRGGNRSDCARPFCFREEGYLSYPLATFARQALFPSHCFMQTRSRCTGRVARRACFSASTWRWSPDVFTSGCVSKYCRLMVAFVKVPASPEQSPPASGRDRPGVNCRRKSVECRGVPPPPHVWARSPGRAVSNPPHLFSPLVPLFSPLAPFFFIPGSPFITPGSFVFTSGSFVSFFSRLTAVRWKSASPTPRAGPRFSGCYFEGCRTR